MFSVLEYHAMHCTDLQVALHGTSVDIRHCGNCSGSLKQEMTTSKDQQAEDSGRTSLVELALSTLCIHNFK